MKNRTATLNNEKKRLEIRLEKLKALIHEKRRFDGENRTVQEVRKGN